jgi:hypothetical protein
MIHATASGDIEKGKMLMVSDLEKRPAHILKLVVAPFKGPQNPDVHH